ncbi:hypothetical protein ANCDUO_00722 [Ancylostoma duodenale]|uniref:Uncharacterized protein n=1 Tax=Ancylostoma duodenale TaxID=51022 RepID=A0A0C2DG53_9BILA|nr:hypothetical protein ANCDUO_00722 [Ancylostoma duodenale]
MEIEHTEIEHMEIFTASRRSKRQCEFYQEIAVINMATEFVTEQVRQTRRDRVYRRRLSENVARTKACTVVVCVLSVFIFYIITAILPENLGSKQEDDTENSTN